MLAETTVSRNGHEMDMPYADVQHIWESAKRSGLARVQMAKYRVFLQAYLQALAEDEGTVEAVASILRDPYGGIYMQADNILSTLLQRAGGRA